MMVEAKKIPQLEPPAVYFPYGKMGQSAAGIACDLSGGKFGPFQKQLFVGDQTHSTVMRVFLEKVQRPLSGRVLPVPRRLRQRVAVAACLRRTARCSSAAPTAAGARAARSPIRSSGWSGPARRRSRSTRCGPSPTASS